MGSWQTWWGYLMQSQQKRVKWSRGETAEALEERTDTGITQASVELMENCIPDIYGNISRRPSLQLMIGDSYIPVQNDVPFGVEYDTGTQYAVFYITEDDFVICAIHTHAQPEFIRIKNSVMVAKYTATETTCWNGVLSGGSWVAQPISYAQQNNYMIIATATNTFKLTLPTINSLSFVVAIERWEFSAGWYAPEGTHTRSVSTTDLNSLNFHGGFETKVFTDASGTTTSYSLIDTGLSASSLARLKTLIPEGSIVQLPNIGCYFRVEGYVVGGSDATMAFEDITFDGVIMHGDPIPQTGTYCMATTWSGQLVPGLPPKTYGRLYIFIDGHRDMDGPFFSTRESGLKVGVYNTASTSGISVIEWGNDAWNGTWSDSSDAKVYAYGALLTPVADDTASDTAVTVEYGYESLQPKFAEEQTFPHPKKVVFNDQRLWAGAWAYSATQEYALTIGSQIARYNDFKNDYNQENEPITLDILTQFKERILHLVDYNGLKIFTDSYEYAYTGGGVVKQSSNGAYENCMPLVFESLCLYVDSTGKQVKAMQYEFQSNIFNSTSINQVAPHDLVWWPFAMAAYEDKEHASGKYLFLVNARAANIPNVAVCNFVPGNQANIWSRWTAGNVKLTTNVNSPFISNIVHTKSKPIFMVTMRLYKWTDGVPAATGNIVLPAEMRFASAQATDIGDMATFAESFADPVMFMSWTVNGTLFSAQLVDREVAVYHNGTFLWNDTLDSDGKLTKDFTQYEYVTIGLPVHATIRSHPIDVSGKTKSIKKRIGKAQMSVHDTDAGAITINGKTGYMNPAKDHICFYGVTGMKNEIKYTITNNNGAMFHLESLLMNIEYGTLIS